MTDEAAWTIHLTRGSVSLTVRLADGIGSDREAEALAAVLDAMRELARVVDSANP